MLQFLLRQVRAKARLNNGHWQTILPHYLTDRFIEISYQRQRLATEDGDFIDLDWVNQDLIGPPTLVLFHGMEGNSQSHYAKRIMSHIQQIGWRGVVVHFRGCSGQMNSTLRFYHGGETNDIRFVLQKIRSTTTAELFLSGVSLGGNALLKYLGETELVNVDAAIAISVPFDLQITSLNLDHGLNRHLYVPYFLDTLLPKMKYYARQFPNFKLKDEIKNLDDFNDQYITQMFNFRDALDYYQQASSISYLKKITTPTLIIQSYNDPMIPVSCWPQKDQLSDSIRFLKFKTGGHAGFLGSDLNLKKSLLKLPQLMQEYYTKFLQTDSALNKVI